MNKYQTAEGNEIIVNFDTQTVTSKSGNLNNVKYRVTLRVINGHGRTGLDTGFTGFIALDDAVSFLTDRLKYNATKGRCENDVVII